MNLGTFARLTFEGIDLNPVWSPDNTRIAFRSNRTGSYGLFCVPADGSGNAERLLSGDYVMVPYSWSRDNRLLAYVEIRPDTKQNIWFFHMDRRSVDPMLALRHE